MTFLYLYEMDFGPSFYREYIHGFGLSNIQISLEIILKRRLCMWDGVAKEHFTDPGTCVS